MEVKACRISAKWKRLPKLHFPAIAESKGGKYVILTKVGENEVLIQDPAEARPSTLSREECEAAWSGKQIMLTIRAREAGEHRRFDFTWFIPSVVRFRRIKRSKISKPATDRWQISAAWRP
jgi:subfamily B ATP-binding cassette protein HlyB/CyaB